MRSFILYNIHYHNKLNPFTIARLYNYFCLCANLYWIGSATTLVTQFHLSFLPRSKDFSATATYHWKSSNIASSSVSAIAGRTQIYRCNCMLESFHNRIRMC